MARPNFFCKVDALQQLLELDLPEIEPNVELSIDLIELPYLFLYTVDDQAWTMKVLQRGELYDHKSKRSQITWRHFSAPVSSCHGISRKKRSSFFIRGWILSRLASCWRLKAKN